MIENLSDLLSAIVIVSIPFVMFVFIISTLVRSLSGSNDLEKNKQVEFNGRRFKLPLGHRLFGLFR